MSEGSNFGNMPSISEVHSHLENEDILTINILNNNEDVDAIKARLKEMRMVSTNDETEGGDQGPDGTISGNVEYNKCSNRGNNTGIKHQDSEQSGSELSDLCLSTETLIDNYDSCPSIENGSSCQSERKRNLSGPSSDTTVGLNVNNLVTMATTSVTSGLLISPTSLSQDVHIQMGEANKRMSAVLNSLDLQLVYLPTTKQLVAEKVSQVNGSSDKNDANSDDKSSNVPYSETESVMCDTASSTQLSCSPTKVHRRCNSNSVPGVTILAPGNLEDTASMCETECLIRGRDQDAMSCDCSDFVCNFPRINTNDSLLRTFTDASSLSSISTGTDFSISAASLDEGEGTGHCIDTGDGGFIEISLHSRNSFERTKNPSQDSGFEDKSNKPKRKGLSGFLSRSLFSRRSKESSNSEDGGPGWKLFGKVPPKQAPDKHPDQIKMEYEPECPTLQQKRREEQQTANRAKKEDIEVLSTTALILENRPMNLPTKDPEERERHQREYQSMVEAAKRKELKELKRKKKQKQQQLRLEEQLVAAAQTWTREILPNWESMKSLKKTRDLWWHGLPTNVRGKVWKLAIGNDLNITPELYEICVSRAADKIKQMDEAPRIFTKSDVFLASPEPASSKESSVELIKLDVSRTFPQLCIFQKGGPYHDLLHSLLGAYACYRPDVGYVQGMSFIAAVLLLNMEVADAFICFANLLNRPCQVAFFRIDEGLMKCYFQAYEEFFKENMPGLLQHFKKMTLSSDIYLYDWIFTLFSRSLPLDVACRVWDIYCRDGEEFLFKTALGILKFHESVLIDMDFIHLAQFLTKLPECDNYENMFKCIDTIQMSLDKKNFSQVLASKINMKDNT